MYPIQLDFYRPVVNMWMDCTCDGVDHCAEDGGRLNELFEDVGLCGQRKAIVQHLL